MTVALNRNQPSVGKFSASAMRKWLAILVLGIALIPMISFAQISTGSTGLEATGDEVYGSLGKEGQNIGLYIGERIINPFFGILGLIFLMLMIYGGIIWMTASGNDASVAKAKQIIVRATLGLLIILLSYGFTQFIFQAISK